MTLEQRSRLLAEECEGCADTTIHPTLLDALRAVRDEALEEAAVIATKAIGARPREIADDIRKAKGGQP